MSKLVQIIVGIIMLPIGGSMIASTANSNNTQSGAMVTFIIGAVLAVLGLVMAVHGALRETRGVSLHPTGQGHSRSETPGQISCF